MYSLCDSDTSSNLNYPDLNYPLPVSEGFLEKTSLDTVLNLTRRLIT